MDQNIGAAAKRSHEPFASGGMSKDGFASGMGNLDGSVNDAVRQREDWWKSCRHVQLDPVRPFIDQLFRSRSSLTGFTELWRVDVHGPTNVEDEIAGRPALRNQKLAG